MKKASILLICLLSGTMPLVVYGMERPGKKAKPSPSPQYELEEEIEILPMEMEVEEQLVTLLSADEQTFELAVSVAERSETLKNLIEDAGVEAPLPLPNFSSATLKIIITLLVELDKLLKENEKASPQDQVYIPRAFQPIINAETQKLTTGQIIRLLKGANFLDIPFIRNGLAAIYADRMYEIISKATFTDKKIPWRKIAPQNKFILLQQKIRLPNELINLILKHLTFRESGITQEYSIADYIKEHGYPTFIPMPQDYMFYQNSIDLQNQKLTSLFGIQLLHRETQNLLLSHNCFFDFSLDAQAPTEPFAYFTNLKHLKLHNNRLIRLPEKILTGLIQLHTLDLTSNFLTSLPENIFAPLTQLQQLWLNHNLLTSLPEQLFTSLTQLARLKIDFNQLTTLPEGLFAQLNLVLLDLNNNKLTALPEKLFTPLTQLEFLAIHDNKLSSLPAKLFAGLTQLKHLYLDNNQLSSLPEGLFSGISQLFLLGLSGNQLTHLPERFFADTQRLRILGLFNNRLSERAKYYIERQLPNNTDITFNIKQVYLG